MIRDDCWQAELRAAEVVEAIGISSLPVDPFAIAEANDIMCEEFDSTLPGISGCLMKVGNKFGIFYSSSFANEGFRRFTVAHELGHYFLSGHYQYIFSGGNVQHRSESGYTSDDKYEREADSFAASLLMPEKLFKASCGWNEVGLAAIESLAQTCGTSLTATAIRYSRLTDEPVTVVCSIGNRVQFAVMSKTLKDTRGLTWIRRNTTLPRGTATLSFNSDKENVARARRLTSTSTMETWFDGGGNFELIEEVVGLGSYGRTLTVLRRETLADSDDEEENGESDLENMLPSDRWRQPRED